MLKDVNSSHSMDEDILVFSEEDLLVELTEDSDYWTVLIVDDEESVHDVTKLVLKDFRFQGKGLKLLSAYSVREAKTVLNEHKEICLVLLDVVMESEDSGLNLIHYIREQLENRLTRIILRTGQPGQAPERQVIVNYDINDYKLKTELTADNLFVSVVSALRSFHDMGALEENSRSLEKVIDSSVDIMQKRRISEFLDNVICQISRILCDNEKNDNFCGEKTSGFSMRKEKSVFRLSNGIGQYQDLIGAEAEAVIESSLYELALETSHKSVNGYSSEAVTVHLSDTDYEYVILVKLRHELSSWEKNLVDLMAANISVAFSNLFLNNEMESTQREIIFTLGEVAEARSQEMGFHVKRVSEYSRLLAKLSGLSLREAELIAVASPVHDIGKLTVPDSILNKSGKLTPDEFEIMKKHSQAGYDMLKNSKREILKTAAVIARSHHEWWDGSGYPEGLKGEAIPIYGRIVALADVFDALGSDRVYKAAWTQEEIVAHLHKERATHFDPKLVDLMLDNMHLFLEIKEAFNF